MDEAKHSKNIMLNGPQLSRYGAISKVMPLMAPNAKTFFVGATTLPSYQDFLDDFGPDVQGGTRVFPTLVAALADSNVVTARGDVILVLPGHTETMTAAATIAVSKSGLSIIGLGNGNARPTISYSTAVAASFDITAANVLVQNFIFDMTGIDALTAAINVQAAGAKFDSCLFITGSASAQATLGMLTNASGTRLSITNSVFTATSDAGTTAAVRIVGGADHVIDNCVFTGGYSAGVGAIENLTTACTNTIVRNCSINNLTAGSTKAMVFVAGSTGQIYNNRMQILSGTAPITGAAMSWVGANYYAATIATAGTLI